MAYEIIEPRQGARRPALAACTVSWRPRSSVAGAAHRLAINVASTVREALGWPERGRVQASYDPERNRLRIELVDKGGWSLLPRAGTAVIVIPLDHVEAPTKAAQAVKHLVFGRALELHLPDWAMPPGLLAARDARARAMERAA